MDDVPKQHTELFDKVLAVVEDVHCQLMSRRPTILQKCRTGLTVSIRWCVGQRK